MSSRYGSASIWYLVDGIDMTIPSPKGISYKIMAPTEPSHGIGDSFEEHSPTGITSVEFSQEGAFFNTSTSGSIHTLFSSGSSVAGVVTAGFAGSSIGSPFIGFAGVYHADYEVVASRGELTKANVTLLVSGRADNGPTLHGLGAESGSTDTEASSVDHTAEVGIGSVDITSSTTAQPTVIVTARPHGLATGDTVVVSGHSTDINGESPAITVVDTVTYTTTQAVAAAGTSGTLAQAKSNLGGSCYLHVTALTLDGSSDVVVTVRDSADDVTYGDLQAFASTTAIEAQRIAIASSSAVERYLAQSVAFSSGTTPSITYWVGAART